MSETILSQPEIYRLVNDYIEVHEGFLGNFTYRTHHEFYPHYCDLDIDTYSMEGTTRERFLAILTSANARTQAKIIRGILRKFPVDFFPEDDRELKQSIFEECERAALRLESASQDGVHGAIKNLIFAADGPKPRIVLRDATTNEIEIVKNAEFCLVYDREITEKGLTWGEIVHWWRECNELDSRLSETDIARNLHRRLLAGQNEPERIIFDTYYAFVNEVLQFQGPALIPQVYLHYDPYTITELGDNTILERQRMDFLILLPYRVAIVIELDGQQHYSDDGRANPRLYSKMVQEDRDLRLRGYEIYRFGGYEFIDVNSAKLVMRSFFERLFKRHGLLGRS